MGLEETIVELFGSMPYQSLIDEINDFAIFYLDTEGRILSWNRGAESIFGYDKDEIVEQNFDILFTPEDRAREVSEKELKKAAETGRAEDTRWHLRKDNSRFFAQGVTIALNNKAGKLAGYARIARDETARKRLEETLLESEEKYRIVAESASDAIISIDEQSTILFINPAAQRIFGYEIEQMIDRPLTMLMPEYLQHVHSAGLKRYLETGKRHLAWEHIEVAGLHKDGHEFPLELSFGEYKKDDTHIFIGIARDITERKRAEEAVRAGNELYEIVARSTNDAIWDWNLLTNKLSWNDGMQTLFGYASEEISGSIDWWYEHLHPEDRSRIVEGIRRVIDLGGQQWSDEYRFIKADESFAEISNRGFVIRDRAGKPVRMLGGMTDITERKRSEGILQRYRLLSEKAREIVCILRLDGQIVEVNQAAVSAYGYSREELLGMNVRDLREPSTLPRLGEELIKANEGEIFETVHIRKNGTTFPVEIHANGADFGGERLVMGIVRDLTESKRAENALRESEKQLRILADSIPQLAWMAEADGFIFWYNRRWYEYTGTTPDEMKGWGWQSVHDEKILPQVIERWQQSIATGEPFEMEFPLKREDGEFRWFLTRVNALRDSQGNITRWFGTNTDIHENRIAQQNAEFLDLVSEDLARLTTVEEIMQTIGAKISKFLNLSICNFVEINEAADEAVVTYDWHREDALSSVGVYRLKEFLTEDFQRAGRAGEIFVVRDVFEDARTDGEKYAAIKIGSFVCVPLVRNGQWRFMLNIHDSSPRNWRKDEIELVRELAARVWMRLERVRTEEERERLLQSEQIARQEAERANRLKDEFLATLSHELRTPLNSILGWSQILQNSDLNSAGAKSALETIERNARAQNQLIEDLLDVSRIITGKLRLDVCAVDLESVIMAATEAARPAAEAKNIRLQILLDPQAAQISGDPDRLQQVVWNLLSNAIKFTRKDGRVQVRLERIDSHVEIVVSDTGVGIEPQFLPFVFDRFRQSDGSTTRRHGGLGLGLAIERQLVELHGGTVTVSSAGEGQGSTFIVSLPLLPIRREPLSDVQRVHPTAPIGSLGDCPPELSGLRVLLVDDEADSRDLLNFVLESCGALVKVTSSAAEAIEEIKREIFDVIISDIGMPEEDGYSLIAKIRNLPDEQGGNVPAIALTAYARAEDRVKALRAGFQLHLAKPVESFELIAAIASLAGQVSKQK